MIYLFYGEDSFRAKQKFKETINALLVKKGEGAYFSLFEINDENFSKDELKQLINSHHLFGDKNLVTLKNAFKNKEAADFLTENMGTIATSKNIFLFLEKEVENETFEKFETHAVKILEFKKQEEKKPEQKNTEIFKLTDAVAQKNKKLAWLIFQKMLLNGTSEEEIFWKIFWQVKNISALKPHENESPDLAAKKFSLHPFVIKKTLSASKLFTKKELENLSKKLIKIFENERFNKIDLNLGIEELILNL